MLFSCLIVMQQYGPSTAEDSDVIIFKGLPATRKDHMLKPIGRGSFGHVSLCRKGKNVSGNTCLHDTRGVTA